MVRLELERGRNSRERGLGKYCAFGKQEKRKGGDQREMCLVLGLALALG